MWDNLGNVMDLSRSVFYSLSHPEHLKMIRLCIFSGKRKAIKNANYKLYSDRIMSKLLEIKELRQTCQISDFVEIGNSISNGKVLTKDIDVEGIVSRMKYEELIVKNESIVMLTEGGEKRFKRTSKSDREKWKRGISNIVCTFLNIGSTYAQNIENCLDSRTPQNDSS